MRSAGTARSPLPIVIAVTGMGVLTFSLIAPVLPDLADALGVPRSSIGLIQGAVAIPGIFLAMAIGYLADRRGRRFIGVASLLVFGVAGTAGFFARSFWALVVVRAVQGLGTSGILTSQMILEIRDTKLSLRTALATGFFALCPSHCVAGHQSLLPAWVS